MLSAVRIYILLEQGTAKEETEGKEELTFILKQTNKGKLSLIF